MDNSYLWLKTLHLVGVILFLGNIIITGWWKTMADRTRNPQIIAFAQRQVTLTDFIFTAGGGGMLLAAGLGNVISHHIDYWHTRWIGWGMGLFIASGVIWAFILIPIQIKQAALAKTFAHGEAIPDMYWRLGKLWIVFGALATALPLIAVYWMVFKLN
ncbi:MAG TPA: DUF2269 family protein [Methylophilaceae bacterium]|jgi:uncharacterized membrane protein